MDKIMVKIIGKFNCQSFPLDDTAIEVTQEELDQIGITKCFDIERNCVINYDSTNDNRIKEINTRIIELKQLLAESDYRAIKYAEGEYTEEQYAPYKEQRRAYRAEINTLEVELATLC